jgi:hypothetical protein
MMGQMLDITMYKHTQKHIKTWTHTQSCIEMIDLSNTLRHGSTHSQV